jgi:hypothetical protein
MNAGRGRVVYPATGENAMRSVRFGLFVLVCCIASSALAAPPKRDPALAQARGHVGCRLTENGAAASGTVSVRKDGEEVASGSCGSPVAVPPGEYDVVLGLDGAIDRPERTQHVTVRAGATAETSADFQTAILEVDVTSGGHRAAGLATISRNGDRVGTLGSGVAGHLSAGTYDVVVRYRTNEQRFTGVTLSPGERRQLAAAF